MDNNVQKRREKVICKKDEKDGGVLQNGLQSPRKQR